MDARRIDLLQQMPLFGGMSAATLELLAGDAHPVEMPAGGFFFREGEAGEHLFVLESGRVGVLREGGRGVITLRELGPGDCFGEMALIDFAPRSASVQALEPSRAVALPIARLHRLYEQDLEQFALLQMNLARELSRRLRVTMDRLTERDAPRA